MGSPVATKTDICTGHGCWPPRPVASWSPNVFAEGLNVHRQGDLWESHCCGPACHSGRLASGSSTVYVNGKQICRIGDPVDCGSKSATGRSTVFAGG